MPLSRMPGVGRRKPEGSGNPKAPESASHRAPTRAVAALGVEEVVLRRSGRWGLASLAGVGGRGLSGYAMRVEPCRRTDGAPGRGSSPGKGPGAGLTLACV